MALVVLSKEKVLENISKIAKMNLKEVDDFGLKISLSEIDEKAKKFLYKAIGIRKKQLSENDGFVVNGDIDDMDFK